MPANWNFYDKRSAGDVDFSPILRGAENEAAGMAAGANALAQGYMAGLKMKEERRQFDLDQTLRNAHLKVAQDRVKAERESAALTFGQDEAARQWLLKYAQSADPTTREAISGMVASKADPKDIFSLLTRAESDRKERRMQEAALTKIQEELKDREDAARVAERGITDGVIPKKQADAARAQARENPRGFITEYLNRSQQHADERTAVGLRDMTVNALSKQVEEGVTSGFVSLDEGERQMRFINGLSTSALSGDDLRKQIESVKGEISKPPTTSDDIARARLKLSEESAARQKEQAANTVLLPGGGRVQDKSGLGKGGTFSELHADPVKMTVLTNLANAEAQKDKRWPDEAVMAAIESMPGITDEQRRTNAQNAENTRLLLRTEYADRIARSNGWRETPSKEAAVAKPSASDFARRIQAGEFGDADSFDESKLKAAMDAAGVTEADVLKAGGGG